MHRATSPRGGLRPFLQKSLARSLKRSEEHTSELQSHSDLHSFPTRRSSDLVAVLIIAIVLLGAWIWWRLRPGIIEIRTVPARAAGLSGSDRTVLNASGYVTARRAATVSSKVTGKVIEEIGRAHV